VNVSGLDPEENPFLPDAVDEDGAVAAPKQPCSIERLRSIHSDRLYVSESPQATGR
jgi:hypothetical protein